MPDSWNSKSKNKGGRCTVPLNPLEVTLAGRGGACNHGQVQLQWPPTSWSTILWQATICDKSTGSHYLGYWVLFAHLSSHKQWTKCSRNMCTDACHVARWAMGSCYCATCLNCLKLTTIYCPSLSLEDACFQKTWVPKTVISDRFRRYDYCLDEEIDS